jgi:hypothetical protein
MSIDRACTTPYADTTVDGAEDADGLGTRRDARWLTWRARLALDEESPIVDIVGGCLKKRLAVNATTTTSNKVYAYTGRRRRRMGLEIFAVLRIEK